MRWDVEVQCKDTDSESMAREEICLFRVEESLHHLFHLCGRSRDGESNDIAATIDTVSEIFVE